MFKIDTIARTVKVIKPYTQTTRNGKNGTFTVEEALFTVASDRPYSQSVTKADGTTEQKRVSDFLLCKVTGNISKIWHDNCEIIDANGKLMSRRLYLSGHLETYQKTSSAPSYQYAGYNGEVRTHNQGDSETKVIFIVTSIEFLDARPSGTVMGASAVPGMTPEMMAMMAQFMQAQQAGAIQQAVPTPAPAMPVAPVPTPTPVPAVPVAPTVTPAPAVPNFTQAMSQMAQSMVPVAPTATPVPAVPVAPTVTPNATTSAPAVVSEEELPI